MRPFHLTPLLKPKPWGGRRLARFGKVLPDGPIGESWEVADLPAHVASQGQTLVADGPDAGSTLRDLIQRRPESLLGTARPWRDGSFPLLIKYLDAAQHLSVQVHPDEGYAARHPGAVTKSESWYIVAADPESHIYVGLRKGVTTDDVARAAGTTDLVPLLRSIPALVGELHDIPAGTLHAIGPGVLIAEVQTPSDTTFRLYDWNEDYQRAPRPMHIKEGLDAFHIDSRPVPMPAGQAGSRRISSTRYFSIDEHRDVAVELPAGELTVVMTVSGDTHLDRQKLAVGSTVVVPAAAGIVQLDSRHGAALAIRPTPASAFDRPAPS